MKTVRDLYREFNTDNKIPDFQGDSCFTVEQLIWFAEQCLAELNKYDFLSNLHYDEKLEKISREAIEKIYGSPLWELDSNAQNRFEGIKYGFAIGVEHVTSYSKNIDSQLMTCGDYKSAYEDLMGRLKLQMMDPEFFERSIKDKYGL